MPSVYVTRLAEKHDISVRTIERYWEEAMKLAKKKFKKTSKRFYPYAVGIVKNMVGEKSKPTSRNMAKSSYEVLSFNVQLLTLSINVFNFLVSNYKALQQETNIRKENLLCFKHLIAAYKLNRSVDANEFLDASFLLAIKGIVKSILLSGGVDTAESELLANLERVYKELSHFQIRFNSSIKDLLLYNY